MGKTIVVGAGAAGMMAAGIAAERGAKVILIEKNEKPGRKLMITGKGRCNLTNNCTESEFLSNVPRNPRFLYSCISQFGPAETMDFFEKLGLKLKTERGRRVFPESDRAADVVDALFRFVKMQGCRIMKGRVSNVTARGGKVCGVVLEDGRAVEADAVILCTGGMSYPLTGSTGDGYPMARVLGHSVTELSPSLVPIETQESWAADLQGLSLRNVELKALECQSGEVLFREIGEMLFTHFGVSGPLVLSASSHIRSPGDGYKLVIDLKPGLKPEQLEARIQRDFDGAGNRDFKNSLGGLLPLKMIPVAVRLSGIPAELKTNQVTKEMRHRLAVLLKGLELHVKKFRKIDEAIVTSGGVEVKEINPRTMESKIIKSLYFAGEIIDCDAYTGGYNLQIAFSTGYAAGNSVPV